MEADIQSDKDAVPSPSTWPAPPVSYGFDEPRQRRDVVTIPILWLTIALSLLVHVAALLLLIPRLDMQPLENTQLSDLEVQLTQPPSPPPRPPAVAPTPPTQAVIVPPSRPPRPAPKAPTPRPPVLTAPRQSSPSPVPTVPSPPPVVAQPQPPPPLPGDLSSYIEAKRRERGEPAPQTPSQAPSTASGNGRINDAIAANLPSTQSPIDGRDRKKGGGIFQIKSMAYDDAEFEFYGWNEDVDRKTVQRIEVRKGNNSDMRIAVVRRMIAIIRLHAKEDFTWESQRLGKNVTLSARPADNDGLEAFMLQEFFDQNRLR